MTLQDFKLWTESIEALMTVAAIIVAGIWTYRLYVKKRIRFPKAVISQEINAFPLNEDKACVHRIINIKNIGEVILSIKSVVCLIYQLSPLQDPFREEIEGNQPPYDELKKELKWPVLEDRSISWQPGEFEIEPGEEDTIHIDSIIPGGVEIISIYTYCKNLKKHRRELGWQTYGIYRVKDLFLK